MLTLLKRVSSLDAIRESIASSMGNPLRRYSERAGIASVVAGAVLLIAAIATTHWTTNQALAVSAQVARTHQMIATLQEVMEGFGSARFNATLYTMSSHDAFLQQYESGVTRGEEALARARGLLGGDAAQYARLDRVRADADVIVKWLGIVTEARKAGGEEAATQRILRGKGLHSFTEMSDTIREAMDAEEHSLAEREQELATYLNRVDYARMAGMVAALMLLVGGFATMRRQNRLLRRGRERLERAHAFLEHRVQERTRDLDAAATRLAQELAERERQKQFIQEHEELLAAVIDISIDAIFVKDRQGRYVIVNSAAVSNLGRNREDLIGMDDRALFPVAEAEAIAARDREVMAGQKCDTLVEELTVANGAVRTYLTTKAPIYGPDREVRGLCGIARDITEFTRNEAQLRETAAQLSALSSALIDIQENERRALARELHDEVGQQLAALKINLARLSEALPDLRANDRLGDSQQLVEQIIGRIRETALNLRPQILDDLGLAAALHWYAHQQQERTECIIALRAEPTPLPPATATACYRIVQEAVNNALRHGHSTRIDIQLDIQDAEVRLLVADDGCGFDLDAQRQKPAPGMGLLGMQERASLLGGRLVIESAPGCGTTLRARIPLAQTAA